jgi:small-conductance mechanosensitive channel
MNQADLQTSLNLQVFRTNSVSDLLESALIFVVSMALLWVVKVWLIRLLRKTAAQTSTTLDDFLIEVFDKAVLPVLYAGSVWLALGHLDLSKGAARFVDGAFKAIVIFQSVRALLSVLTFFIKNSWIKPGAPGGVATKSILTIVRVLVWLIAALFLLDNLGFDVNAVIAGLGVGGIAVALAAQTILGDLFNYFVIVFDQPFVEGDFIVVDEFKGEIEKIGIKSTRIRSLDGDMLIMSNSNLMSSRIRNFKRMEKRRASFTLGIVYQTSAEKVQRIPDMLRQIVLQHPKAVFDRAHFKSFGPSSLDFEVVYFVLDREYNVYMDIQQKINLEIMKRFEGEGIDFAYPTQTVYNYGEIPQPKLVKN